MQPSEGMLRALALHAQGPNSPAFRVRVMLLRPALKRYGVALVPRPLFDSQEAYAFATGGVLRRNAVLLRARSRMLSDLRESSSSASVALIQRQADLLPTMRIERLAARGRRLVWDVDDAIWHDTHPAAGGHSFSFLKRSKAKATWLARHADCVIVANRFLADDLEKLTNNVSIVPSLIETRAIPVRRHRSGSELVLGWIGSPTTAPYLRRIERAVTTVARVLPDQAIRLLIVGGEPNLVIRGVEIEMTEWTPQRELDALRRMDVGLMPLPDNVWTRGKSAYKALQYMAAAIPVVADDVGVASEVVQNDRAGFIVRSEAEWTQAVLDLAEDPPLRQRFGDEGRRIVEADFSVSRWAPTVAALITGDGRAISSGLERT
jgi:glycosyltransferase involved in cell wall biosynthesis